jgi:hypothetical protein
MGGAKPKPPVGGREPYALYDELAGIAPYAGLAGTEPYGAGTEPYGAGTEPYGAGTEPYAGLESYDGTEQ